jgi:DNA invertase Pin-like site-specific DNA recombinase
MRYGYVRCSGAKQNPARQIEALKAFGIPEENMIVDMESGKIKAEERTNYSILRKVLREGDELVIDALDRLGRKKQDVKDEVEYLKHRKVRLIILSLPTTTVQPGAGQEWVIDLVTNLLIEVYSSIAEQELAEKERRTRAGIELAKEQGKYKGRPKIQIDKTQLARLYPRWKEGHIKTAEYRQLLGGLTVSTFYRAIGEYEQEINADAAKVM